MAADAKEKIKTEVKVPVAIKGGVVELLEEGEEGLPEFATEVQVAPPGDKVGRYGLDGLERAPKLSAEEGEKDDDNQRGTEPDRSGADEEEADILIQTLLVPAMLDITEDAALAGAEEGDVADLVAEEEAEGGVPEFVHHRPRRCQPDMDRLAHQESRADANRRRDQMHRQGDEQNRPKKDQQLFATEEQGLTDIESRLACEGENSHER